MTCFPLQSSQLASTSIHRSPAPVRAVPPLETATVPPRGRRTNRQRRRQSSLSAMNASDQACPETKLCPLPSSGDGKLARTLVGKADDTDVLLGNVDSQHRHAAQLNTDAHPFVERLIGTIRREYLDQTLFWTAADLEEKLRAFQDYFNRHRAHSGLEGRLPEPGEEKVALNFASYRWKQHCRGLYQTPTAA